LKDSRFSLKHNPKTPILDEFFHNSQHLCGNIKTPCTNYDASFQKFLVLLQFLFAFLSSRSFKEHMIFNKIFNQKQVKMKRLEYPSNQKTTHEPKNKRKHSLAA
jgi:hypothetical protein